MKTDAFKPAADLGPVRGVHNGPALKGADLGQHFKMQAKPQQAAPLGPRSLKDGGGRFQPAAEPVRMGSVMPAAPASTEGRAVAPERGQAKSNFMPATAPLPQGRPALSGAAPAAPKATQPFAQITQDAVTSVLVTIEAQGPGGEIYSAPYVADFVPGSKVLGIRCVPHQEQQGQG